MFVPLLDLYYISVILYMCMFPLQRERESDRLYVREKSIDEKRGEEEQEVGITDRGKH